MFKTIRNLVVSATACAAVVCASHTDARAVTLTDGLVADPGVFWNNLPTNSFDNAFWNQFYGQLAPYLDQQAYILPATFNGAPDQSLLTSLHIVEIAGAADENTLSLCKDGGCDTIFTGPDNPGTVSSVPIDPKSQHWFKMVGPSDTFYSDAALNGDGLTHFYAFKVVQDGVVTVSPVTGSNNPTSVTVSLRVGDLLIGIEDRPGFLPTSDRDFNDMLFHARVSEVPEPMSLALLSFGALGAFGLRRKSA